MMNSLQTSYQNPKLRFVYLSIRIETHKVEQTNVGGMLHVASMGQAQGPALGERKVRLRSLVPSACLGGSIKGMKSPAGRQKW